MNLVFKKVYIQGFLSIGEAELELNDRGFVSISGENRNPGDGTKSNGAGKTAAFESILWCLTGETSRGTKDVVNKNTNTGTKVELLFDIDKTEYKIIRTKDHGKLGTNLKIFVNNEDKSGKGIRDTEKLLEQFLPDLTSSLLGSVVILGQGLPQRFTNNTPSGRKEVLEKLTKSDFMIQDLKEKLSTRKSSLQNTIRSFEDKVLSLNSKLEVLKSQIIKHEEDLKEASNTGDLSSLINSQEKELQVLKSQFELLKTEKELTGDSLARKQEGYSELNSKLLQSKEEILKPLKEELSDLKVKVNVSELNIKSKEQEVKSLESIKDICPTCGQKLPDVHKVDTTSLRLQLDSLRVSFTDLKKLLEGRSNSLIEKEKDLDLVNSEKLQKVKEEGISLREKYNKQSKDLESLNSRLSSEEGELVKNKAKLEQLEVVLKNTQKLKESLEEESRGIEREIQYNINEKEKFSIHLEYVNKMITYVTRDFRGYLLSNVIDFIQSRAKEYSKSIFNTDNIEFKLDGNNIYVGYEGKQIEALSGGERQKVDLVIQFSIRDMLNRVLNFNSNILVVDEVFDNLDSIGAEKVINMISSKLSDISSIFIITHHQDIEIPVDEQITVVKNEQGVSSILNG